MKNRLNLNKKPIFFAADFATEEMCSFQDRSDATETPNMAGLSHIFRVFKPKRISGRFLFLLLEIKQRLFSLSRSRVIEDATLFGREGGIPVQC